MAKWEAADVVLKGCFPRFGRGALFNDCSGRRTAAGGASVCRPYSWKCESVEVGAIASLGRCNPTLSFDFAECPLDGSAIKAECFSKDSDARPALIAGIGVNSKGNEHRLDGTADVKGSDTGDAIRQIHGDGPRWQGMPGPCASTASAVGYCTTPDWAGSGGLSKE